MIGKWRRDDRGETLIELVVSLALFALLITMLVTVFNASANSLAQNIETKRVLNDQVKTLILGQGTAVEEQTVSYSYQDGEGDIHTDSFTVDVVTAGGSFRKFQLHH